MPPLIALPEREAQAVLCVRAVEEADVRGTLLALPERLGARAGERFEPFLVQRAQRLLALLERTSPALARLRRASGLRPATAWIVLPAVLFGAASNFVGPDKRINVLANPLAGLLLWNLAIYLLLLVAALRGLAARSTGVPQAGERGAARTPGLGLALRLLTWPARARQRSGAEAERGELLARAGAAYLAGWRRCAGALLGTRLRQALHLGAASMALGALGGMYVRGLLLEYRVTWESTFLGPAQVEAWLSFVLGPAAGIAGIERPGPAALEAIRAPGSGPAATWIHLYAVSTGLLVVAPRLLLAAREGLRARRLAAALPLDTGERYYRRLHAGARGEGLRAEVVPYSYTPGAARLDRLKALLHDVLGARAEVRIAPRIEYGMTAMVHDPQEAAAEAPASAHDETAHVVLFNLAQTPESEVHGLLLEERRRQAQAGGPLLVLVDAAAWRERGDRSPGFERKLDERRRTWDRVVRAAGFEALHVDLDQAPSEDLTARLEAALQASEEREPTP